MKTSKWTLCLSALIITAGISFTACKKDSNDTTTTNPSAGTSADTDTQSAADNAYVENMSNDMDNMGDEGSSGALSTYRGAKPQNSILSTCATVSVYNNVSSDADTLIVDFGTTNCVCNDGKARNGMIRYIYSGGAHYRDSGIVITVTPVNYTVEGNAVSGSKTITNRGRINGNFEWDITSNLTVVKANNGGTITWSCTRHRVLLNTSAVYISPALPINWTQARIGLTGSAAGTTASGGAYTVVITSQLIRDMQCTPNPTLYPQRHPFVQGSFDFTPSGHATRSMNFGTGTCDFAATVTINGVAFNITLM